MVVLPFSSPRRLCGFGVASVAGPGGLHWVLLALVCSRGAVAALLGCSGPSSWQSSCGGGGEVVCCCLSVNVRKARCSSGRKPSPALLRVVVVTAPLGHHSPCWGHHYGESCLETCGLGVKTRSSLLDERQRRHRRRTLLGGATYGDSYRLVAVWGVVWMARVQRQRRCSWSLC